MKDGVINLDGVKRTKTKLVKRSASLLGNAQKHAIGKDVDQYVTGVKSFIKKRK